MGQLLAAHRSQPPPLVTDLRLDVPAKLAALIARCLAKDPADRFQCAAELDKAFGAVLVSHPINQTRRQGTNQADERASRNRGLGSSRVYYSHSFL
jgi:hypothetical protein